jgi:hypothetical protein
MCSVDGDEEDEKPTANFVIETMKQTTCRALLFPAIAIIVIIIA